MHNSIFELGRYSRDPREQKIPSIPPRTRLEEDYPPTRRILIASASGVVLEVKDNPDQLMLHLKGGVRHSLTGTGVGKGDMEAVRQTVEGSDLEEKLHMYRE